MGNGQPTHSLSARGVQKGRSDACKFDVQAAVKRRKMEGSKKHIYYSAAVQIKFSSRVRESKLLAV